MKTLGKRSLSSFLKTIVTIARYFQVTMAILFVLLTIFYIFHPSDDILGNITMLGVLRIPVQGTLIIIGITISLWLSFSLYITFLLEKILASLVERVPFSPENSKRIRFISYAVILSALINIAFNFFQSYYYETYYSIPDYTSVELSFPNLTTFFLGLLIFIISEIFKISYNMQEEQKLIV